MPIDFNAFRMPGLSCRSAREAPGGFSLHAFAFDDRRSRAAQRFAYVQAGWQTAPRKHLNHSPKKRAFLAARCSPKRFSS